jgi:CRP-like cAMP-binding protein
MDLILIKPVMQVSDDIASLLSGVLKEISVLITQAIDLKAFLSGIEPYAGLDPEAFSRLVAAARIVHLERGMPLFEQGQPCTGVHVVVSGQIKLAFYSPHGAEKIVAIAADRQGVGEECLSLAQDYPFHADALVDSTLVFLPRQVLVDCLESSRHFVQRLMKCIAEKFHHLLLDVEAASLLTGSERVVEYLIRDLDDTVQGAAVVELSMAKSVIASRLSLTQEHFSRLLRQLSDSGMIAVDGRQIQIPDVRRMRQYLASGEGHGANRLGRSSGRGRAGHDHALAIAC